VSVWCDSCGTLQNIIPIGDQDQQVPRTLTHLVLQTVMETGCCSGTHVESNCYVLCIYSKAHCSPVVIKILIVIVYFSHCFNFNFIIIKITINISVCGAYVACSGCDHVCSVIISYDDDDDYDSDDGNVNC
jgi:hypothetical protein